MQVDTQEFIPLAEKAGHVLAWDIETSGKNPDYNAVLVVSMKPYGQKPITIKTRRAGDDRSVVRDVSAVLNNYKVWVTFYGRGFDVPFLRGRLLKHGLPDLHKQLHADMYWHLRAHVNPSRKSLAHYARWLGLPEQKFSVDPELWNRVNANPAAHLPLLIRRCESDCEVLEQVWDRGKHLIVHLTK